MTVSAALTVLLWRVTLDDAFITFRYARHLAEGYGLDRARSVREPVTTTLENEALL